LDELDELAGYVAAEANYDNDGKLQREWDLPYARLPAVLDPTMDKDDWSRSAEQYLTQHSRAKKVTAYRSTISVARLFHEALVSFPVVKGLRVEFEGRTVFP
jgi:hypothetical protein